MVPNHASPFDAADSTAAPAPRGTATDDALATAAEALRAADIEAASPGIDGEDWSDQLQRGDLEDMSIDDLRKLAENLHVPDSGQLVEQSDLIAAIRLRL